MPVDELEKQTNELYNKQLEQQQNIVNTSTQQAIDEIERNKQKAQEEADKTNKALYTDYQKQINPYGVNAENLAEQGLANSGLAETTKLNYYNTYQNARTQAQTNANNIKADFDAQIAKARQNGDLQLAQSALKMYEQKINDMYNMYNLRHQQQREEVADQQWQQQYDYNKSVNDRNYNYQVGRDTIADSQWQKEYDRALQQAQWQQQFNQAQFDYNKSIDDRNYNYQRERDAVADSQWEKEYELSKNASSSRSSSSSSRSNLISSDRAEI